MQRHLSVHEQLSYTPFTRCNRLSNLFDNRFDNRVERTVAVRSTGLNEVNEQPLFIQPVVKPGYTGSLTTGCIHDATGYQAVKPV